MINLRRVSESSTGPQGSRWSSVHFAAISGRLGNIGEPLDHYQADTTETSVDIATDFAESGIEAYTESYELSAAT